MRRLLPLLWLVSLDAPAAEPFGVPLPSVDDPPDFAMGQTQDFAVVIGIPSYPLIPGPVAWAEEDARAMARFFLESRGVPADRVRLLLGADATRAGIVQALTEAGQATGPDGVVWVYFAGRGATDPDAQDPVLVLLPVDASETTESQSASGLAWRELDRLVGARGARFVEIIDGRQGDDAARSGGWPAAPSAVGPLATTPAEVVTSVQPYPQHGVFTYFVLGALRGWADGVGGPRDGEVTVVEAFDFLGVLWNAAWFAESGARLGVPEDHPVWVNKRFGSFEAAPAILHGPLVERECVLEAWKVATDQAEQQQAPTVEALQASMRTTWETLKAHAETVLQRPAEDPAPMILAVKDFLLQAEWLKTTQPGGSVTVQAALRPSATTGRDVDCGTRSVLLEASTTAVPVAEVKEAEAILARLTAPPPHPAGAGRTWVGPSGYKMAWVPAGSFDLNSSAWDAARWRYDPLHRVTLTQGYWVGITEVTQGLWSSVTGANPSHFEACGSQCPVEAVSWCDSLAFANALSRQDGLRPAYDRVGGCDANPESVTWDRSADGYRLATDVEWEIAASWDLGRRRRTAVSVLEMLAVGELADGLSASELDAVSWYRSNSGGTPHSVCTRQPNALGLCDASGNVWEWTWDRRGDEPPGETDPAGAYSGSFRILRGGSWDSNPQGMTVTRRLKAGVSDRFDFVGLRLVRSSTIP